MKFINKNPNEITEDEQSNENEESTSRTRDSQPMRSARKNSKSQRFSERNRSTMRKDAKRIEDCILLEIRKEMQKVV